nr:hypothetical protein Iba_chr08cCG10700 [Ipomoea batatas]
MFHSFDPFLFRGKEFLLMFVSLMIDFKLKKENSSSIAYMDIVDFLIFKRSLHQPLKFKVNHLGIFILCMWSLIVIVVIKL